MAVQGATPTESYSNFGLTMLPPCTAVKHPRPGVPSAGYDCERVGALVQYHLKDGVAAGAEQLAGHE